MICPNTISFRNYCFRYGPNGRRKLVDKFGVVIELPIPGPGGGGEGGNMDCLWNVHMSPGTRAVWTSLEKGSTSNLRLPAFYTVCSGGHEPIDSLENYHRG